jgi:hypothetical protein
MHVHTKPFISAQDMQPLPKLRPAKSPITSTTSGPYALTAVTQKRGDTGSQSRQQRPPRQDQDTEPDAPNRAHGSLALLLVELHLDSLS